ncbi:AAA domain-containing protein, putative AbiEii toxin, Type IV TA system [Nannocystis exedens]|uniref:AAA domain-containing protein, putative AbiEii toxin, Type IV TA system n=1 Tax=Nannocystis exedens TaxID=54 RepID=A0A1I1T479_9BACT|nr:ATP-binding protein [Nannocystis exedens]PCC75742.1 ATPase [Nannocystis exedens]SFD50130.1 AAA domain-containing protein, putative AbiEii toxin, Type IV TA system [Nannocystis exedens]
MLRELHLIDTGPSPRLDVELAERLNILTGDNGLGKSFLLDVIWWVMTGTWAGLPAGPFRPPGRPFAPKESHPELRWLLDGAREQTRAAFKHSIQQWSRPSHAFPTTSGPYLFAHADGRFSLSDSQRWPRGPDEPCVVFPFDERAIWYGHESKLCKGLLDDWVTWCFMYAAGQSSPYPHLERVLQVLSPHPHERLVLGQPTRVSRSLAQDIPILEFPHAAVPVIHASAGMKRILSLAYMLVWTYHEHVRAAELSGVEPARELLLLIDEVEAHLHPQWQRRILPALLEAIRSLWGDVHVQLVVTTHSPLVLASLEPHFEPERDALFRFELVDGRAAIECQPWAKQGDVVNWLVSDNFGLEQARSVEAERAIEAAEAFMRGDTAALSDDLRTKDAIDAQLRRLLPGIDPFWPRWIVSTRVGS